MKRTSARWTDALKKIFSPVRRKRPSTRLTLERLDDRINPVTIFTPPTLTTDGLVNTLRAVLTQANNTADDVEIQLQSGATYTLTIPNGPLGQENANARGDLDVFDNSGLTAIKTYTFKTVGGTTPATITAGPGFNDRIFQIIGNDVVVHFQNVIITGGVARDDGTAGALPGSTDARGGGVLNSGGANVFFTDSIVTDNVALGQNGTTGATGANDNAAGAPYAGNGADGTNGRNAFGGGIYSVGGTITLVNTRVLNNTAQAGNGGNGGNGGNVTGTGTGPAGNGGNGGNGGNAAGGGIYAMAGSILLQNGSLIRGNDALGGDGGDGGDGGSTAVATNPLPFGGKGGTGGNGGFARGGGIFIANGMVSLTGGSIVDVNNAEAGDGGGGGSGGDAATGFGGLGGSGGDGGEASGGGIHSGGGTVTVDVGSSVKTNTVSAGSGGSGGSGGTGPQAGGNGGNGGTGANATGGGIHAASGPVTINNNSKVILNTVNGGSGGDGGDGGSGTTVITGGNGGNGGTGGTARGGGVFIASGSLLLGGGSLLGNNTVEGGFGGDGGSGGSASQFGGKGGNAGLGGSASGGGVHIQGGNVTISGAAIVSQNTVQGGDGGDGGFGGDVANGQGGNGGNGAKAGDALGGGIFAGNGTVTVSGSSVISFNTVQGGTGGYGGNGGDATGTTATGNGGDGGLAADGGNAFGGGVYIQTGQLILNNAQITSNSAFGGNGDTGGTGGDGGTNASAKGGIGTNGSSGGSGAGGGVYVFSGSISVSNGSLVANNSAAGGNGGFGGFGGDGVLQGGNAGNGGNGGAGRGGGLFIQNGGVSVTGESVITNNSAFGGVGGPGGNGGNAALAPGSIGGNGGRGGNGGAAEGGGIWAANGPVTIANSSLVTSNSALAGNGNSGGNGGSGFSQNAGNGGAGGNGGSAAGGGIFTIGGAINVTTRSQVGSNLVIGGAGLDGGNGGFGGTGAAKGGNGGNGGAGGNGNGGGLHTTSGTVTVNLASVTDNIAQGGDGGNGGNGGPTFPFVGFGGNGGAGGNAQGGGIFVGNGTLTLSAANIKGNLVGGTGLVRADGGNGGAGASTGAGLAGSGGKGGDALGAGLFVGAGSTLTVRNSSIVDNGLKNPSTAVAGFGGAPGIGGGGLGGNGGNTLGGGLYVLSANALISNSTISGNFAGFGGLGGGLTGLPGESRGGGVWINSANGRIRNSTIVENQAARGFINPISGQGGGIRNQGTLSLVSTIVGNNNTINVPGFNNTTAPGRDLSSGALMLMANNNLISTTGGHPVINGTSGNIVKSFFNPLFTPNGGNTVYVSARDTAGNGTEYHRLVTVAEFGPLPASAATAINNGVNPDMLLTDQIGGARVQDGAADIGAIEGAGDGAGVTATSFIAVSTSNGAVALYDTNTTAFITSFRPFDTPTSKYTGVVSVALGDVNGDGIADIITATRGRRNGRVKVWDGASAFVPGVQFNNPSTWYNSGGSILPNNLTSPLFARINPFGGYKGGLTVASADINNDGHDDIIIGSGRGVVGRVVAYSGANPLLQIGQTFNPFGPNYTGGVYVAGGNVTGGPGAEIVVSRASGNTTVAVYQLTGSSWSPFSTFTAFSGAKTGAQVAVVDNAGTGTGNIAVGRLLNGNVEINVFNASGTALIATPYTAVSGVTAFGLGAVDPEQDMTEYLLVGVVPTNDNQLNILDLLSGTQTGLSFTGVPVLFGDISVAGV